MILFAILGGIALDAWVSHEAQPLHYASAYAGENTHPVAPTEILIEARVEWTPERIEREYREAAARHNIQFEPMWQTVLCENTRLEPGLQSWHPDPTGPNGQEDSWGISQIHLPSWPHITRSQAKDPAFSAEFMAEKFAAGSAYLWTCYRKLYM